MATRKIINDPVYGFITVDHPLIFSILNHPWFQRLRRIKQMALAALVYPGAVHTRFHHSLGAYHLMSCALTELKSKGVRITPEEELAAKAGILLHDIGHGPFSHALENVLIEDRSHESISRSIMRRLNEEFNDSLDVTISVFDGQYPKRFLHQLISGQLDVDRMDYLTRDSFFTGVSEGVIGYDRILKMLAVHEGELMVEEKGIYSIEKFLVARRLMYWQVYLHKTVLSAEQMLVRVLERAKDLGALGELDMGDALDLDRFCSLDDSDVEMAMKGWTNHPDRVLSVLSASLLDRHLLKIRFREESVSPGEIEEKRREVAWNLGISEEEAAYFVFEGTAVNSTYDAGDETIRILFKDGGVRDVSEVDNALIRQTLASHVKKFYFCYPGTVKSPANKY